MAPRRYNRQRRDEALAETRRRIVEAAVTLHAERGPLGTTYAMIAERANVAVPTVYNHFPKTDELFAACVGHGVAKAPRVGPEMFAGLADTPARLNALVSALFARHRFLAPWLRRSQHEAHLLPGLAAQHRKMHEGHLSLIGEALAPRFGSPPPPELSGLVEIMTRFSAWETLTMDHGLSHEAAASAVQAALRDLVEHYGRLRRASARRRERPPPIKRQTAKRERSVP